MNFFQYKKQNKDAITMMVLFEQLFNASDEKECLESWRDGGFYYIRYADVGIDLGDGIDFVCGFGSTITSAVRNYFKEIKGCKLINYKTNHTFTVDMNLTMSSMDDFPVIHIYSNKNDIDVKKLSFDYYKSDVVRRELCRGIARQIARIADCDFDEDYYLEYNDYFVFRYGFEANFSDEAKTPMFILVNSEECRDPTKEELAEIIQMNKERKK